MNLNTKYTFREGKLGHDFCKDFFKSVKEQIDSSTSFTIIGIPSVGVSFFLRFLTMQDFAYFIHVDLYALPTLTKIEFYKAMLRQLDGKVDNVSEEELLDRCRKKIEELAKNHTKIVLILNRFDQLQKEFDKKFFENIRSLRNIDGGKIVIITTATRPLDEINAEAISGSNLNFYSKHLFFKPYSLRT